MSDGEITDPELRLPSLLSQAGRRASPTPRRLSWGAHLARVLLVMLAMLGLFFSITPWGRASVRGVLVLPGLVAARQLGPIVATGEPIHRVSLTVPSQGGTVYLDVWEPTTPPPLLPGTREGVLIIPGAGDNRTTAQLINLTESLARADLVAMTMTTPALIAYRLTPLDGDAVVQAFLTLQHWPGVGANRVGILAFSAGSSSASLAAVDPRITGSIAFLTDFGGFYNARDLFTDVGRRALLVNGKLQPWTPDPVTLSVLANTTAGTLSPTEGAVISSAWDFHHPKPLSLAQVAQLSPAARAAYHLLAGDEPNQVQSNLDTLTPAMQQLLQQFSRSSVVARIRAPVYLLHDHSDTFVPFTESRDFAAALAGLRHSYQFVEFSIFRHTEVRTTLDVGSLLHDGPRLFGIIYSTTLPST